MQHLPKIVMRFVFYIFALGLLGVTGLRTFSLLSLTTGNDLTAIAGLLTFELGMLIWLGYARYAAENPKQRALALIASGLDLGLVLFATGADVFVETTLADVDASLASNVALWTIIIAAIANVTVMWLIHILEAELLTEPTATAKAPAHAKPVAIPTNGHKPVVTYNAEAEPGPKAKRRA